MKSSLFQKLESLQDRHEEVAALLSDADTAANPKRFRALSQEYSQLDSVVSVYAAYMAAKEDLDTAELMLDDSDEELRELAAEQEASLEAPGDQS